MEEEETVVSQKAENRKERAHVRAFLFLGSWFTRGEYTHAPLCLEPTQSDRQVVARSTVLTAKGRDQLELKLSSSEYWSGVDPATCFFECTCTHE